MRVDLLQGGEQAAGQDDLQVVAALRRVAVVGDVGAVSYLIPTLLKPS